MKCCLQENKRLRNEDSSESPARDVEEGECSDSESTSEGETSEHSDSSGTYSL